MIRRNATLSALGLAAALLAHGTAAQETAATDDAEPAQPALSAGEATRAVTLEIGGGLEYDSSVAVLELDTNSNEGDTAAVLDFGVGYDAPTGDRVDLTLGYDLSDTRHEDFGDFDVRIHRASANVSYDLGRVDTGVNLQYAHAELDGSEFLVLRQLSPFVSKLVGQRLFLRFAYADTDKSFAGNPGRDAAQQSLSADAYYFVNGLSTYFVFGYRRNDEDALDAALDYTGGRTRVQLTKRLELDNRTVTLRTSLQAEARDYSSPTPTLGEQRRDDRRTFEAAAEVPLRGRLTAAFEYRYADYDSNLQSLDFDENVVSAKLRATF